MINSPSDDYELVYQLVGGPGTKLKTLSIEQIVFIENPNSPLIDYASDRLKKDKKIAIRAVQNCARSFERLCSALRDDEDVVLEAIKFNPIAFDSASDRLKKDKKIVLQLVKIAGLAIAFSDISLIDDYQIGLAAVKNDETAFNFLGPKLRKNYLIMEHVKDSRFYPQFFKKLQDPHRHAKNWASLIKGNGITGYRGDTDINFIHNGAF